MISRRDLCRLLSAGVATLAVGVSGRGIAARQQGEIIVGLQNNVFANLFDGRPTGIIIEAIDIILRKMGRNPIYIVMPAGDIVAGMADGTVAVNSVTVEVASNRSQALFTDPIVTEYNVIAIPAAHQLALNRLSDLYGLKLGGREGYQYPLLEKDPQINLRRFSQDGELIRNLILGHIDAAVISALSDVYKLRAEGVMPRIRLLSRAVGVVPLRASLSHRTFTSADLENFNQYLAELKASKVWAAILEKNGFADLVEDWPTITQ